MTLQQIRDFIAAIDPNAEHYESTDTDNSYTVWMETRRLPVYGNGNELGGWECSLDRYTDTEFDSIAAAFETAFAKDLRFCYTYRVSYDVTRHRIHHAFVFQVV